VDITLILNNNFLIFDWYHKPTFSGRFLHYESRHPLCHKRGTAIGLIDRAFRLSHPRFHEKNLRLVVNILLENGYPLIFLFETLKERIKILISRQKTNQKKNDIEDDTGCTHFFNIPYVPTISERFKTVVRDLNIKLSYTGLNKLHEFIHVQKDELATELKSNVVYKISCKDCDASYVG